MFRTVASLMTAASVLWHAMNGCCAHHGHELEAIETAVVAAVGDVTPPEVPRCRCKHKSPPATHESATEHHNAVAEFVAGTNEPAKHSPSGPCEGERCSFVVGQITTAGDLDLLPHGAGYPVVANLLDIVASETRENAQDADIEPPRLRRHLALSILLI